MGFAKLWDGIVLSTIWRAPDHVRLLWITMLALADRHGTVLASVPGLADAAHISVEDCRDALRMLAEPDPDSRTQDFEGRRIQDVDGGWLLLNYPKYRQMRDEDKRREQVRAAVERHRARKRERDAV